MIKKLYLTVFYLVLFVATLFWKETQLMVQLRTEINTLMTNQVNLIKLVKLEDEKSNLQYEKIQKQITKLQTVKTNTNPVTLTKKYFPNEPATALAIFKTESELNPKAQGWNCFFDVYGNAVPYKTAISWTCPIDRRSMAWSVDCGIVQNNFIGQECPEESFDIEWSIKEAKRKYDEGGFNRWSTYLFGTYKKNLQWAYAEVTK